MYHDLLKRAADCRVEATRCINSGREALARRWLKLGKGFIASARRARFVFLTYGASRPLP